MKILYEGKAHKRYAWFATCDTCNSELRILEGDPMAGSTCYNCEADQHYIRYICPVCGGKKTAWTRSSFGEKSNAEYKEIVLNKEDQEEIDNFSIVARWFGEDELKHIMNRARH